MPGSVSLPGQSQPFTTDASANAINQRDNNGGTTNAHYMSTGEVPTAAAGSNAGSSPPAPILNSNSNDTRGSLTCGTGTSAAAGNLVTVTFDTAYAIVPIVSIEPLNGAAAALLPYVTSVSTTGFTIAVQSAPASSQANTTYGFSWITFG
jgi:hypothetical protein